MASDTKPKGKPKIVGRTDLRELERVGDDSPWLQDIVGDALIEIQGVRDLLDNGVDLWASRDAENIATRGRWIELWASEPEEKDGAFCTPDGKTIGTLRVEEIPRLKPGECKRFRMVEAGET